MWTLLPRQGRTRSIISIGSRQTNTYNSVCKRSRAHGLRTFRWLRYRYAPTRCCEGIQQT